MYEVSVVMLDGRFERHRCETIVEVLDLLGKLDDDTLSTVAIKRLEDRGH